MAGRWVQGLRTRKLREEQEAERLSRLGPVTLRFNFPDDTVLQVPPLLPYEAALALLSILSFFGRTSPLLYLSILSFFGSTSPLLYLSMLSFFSRTSPLLHLSIWHSLAVLHLCRPSPFCHSSVVLHRCCTLPWSYLANALCLHFRIYARSYFANAVRSIVIRSHCCTFPSQPLVIAVPFQFELKLFFEVLNEMWRCLQEIL